ncbi:phosphatase PAP2 family protein [Shewanella avicenniae]|uniref:Phosphatase PAP2 family protein n=1 Tax=Shewanella avicenniae TaxID=2814294 RepID=A0ABX7QLD0_9GAMM|nr:phosphatase PAP2 family protein [Shewanella avicenniae]QSX32074.1 phosphatase PAP2 family protein [Shewanella avicenniae]
MLNREVSATQWYAQQLLLPCFVGLVILTFIHQLSLDLLLANWLFALEGGNGWSLRHQWFLETVIHSGGRHLVTAASVLAIVLTVLSHFINTLKPYRKALWMLLGSVASTILLVRYGKQITNVSCPWDLTLFGGTKPYIEFPQTLNSNLSLGQCYPGGHSSGAFAWVALYYVALVHRPQSRRIWLAVAMMIGLTFGIAQELRGAHFLSHDLTSLLMAWLIATTFYCLIYRPWQSTQRAELKVKPLAALAN